MIAMKTFTMSDRLRYKFDNTMSKGPIALILYLFIASAVLIVVISLFVVAAKLNPPGEELSLGEVIWMSLMRVLDVGTMDGDEGWAFRFAMLAITMGGIFLVSMLIGVLTTGIEGKIEELRKGRSFVVEENHTVILGWSSQIYSIISELVIANENQRHPCIAILADRDKVEMEDDVHSKVADTKNTRIVCRTGSPIDMAELEIVNPHGAKSIIILSPETNDPDSHVIKAILALTNHPNRRPTPHHIVAEIRDLKNAEAARLVSGDEAQLVFSDELISRITAQTCRQSGLSVIYTELLDFGGDEIYIKEEPQLTGKKFSEAMFAYEDSALLGICKNGTAILNPPMDTVIENGDRLVAVSEDDDTVRLSNLTDYKIDLEALCKLADHPSIPERTLIMGWNRRGSAIIKELDNYVSAGSIVTVVTDVDEAESEIKCQCDHLKNQQISFRQADTTKRNTLESLDVPSYDHVILLSCMDDMDPQECDAHTLITLLHLRDMSEKCGHPFSIVSEMLDIRNRELAEVTRADDFIVSDKLISLILSQVSESKDLKSVFQDLFDPDGSELYLKPASDYVKPGKSVNFYTVLEAARQRNEVALGYRIRSLAGNPAEMYGVRVNPKKSDLITLAPDDRIIVLADN